MEPRHHLRCLGQPALFAPNGEPIRFRTKKHLALLVYLAVEHRQAHRRDRLAEFLWPRAETAEARHSLATALSVLRPRLGPAALATTREHVTLHSDRLTLDLDRLVAKDVLGTEVTGMLEVSSFLDGFDIPDAPEFAMWKDRQQARLLPTIKDALLVLIDRCRRTGESRQIELLAEKMMGLDELSEEAVRAKMEGRALAGDRLTALKVYEEWKTRLFQELHAAPSSEVDKMAARLRRGGWERTAINDIPVPPPGLTRERAFVGRAREYGILYELWESLKSGHPIHAVLLGDSGVGKTTLVERLTTAASLEGATVARVQAYDLERNIPFATLGGLIGGLIDRPGASGTPSETLSELARNFPEVRRRFPHLPFAAESRGETARIRLTGAFHQLLSAIAHEHPVILVVDDLHLADEPSLAVLHLVLRRSTEDQMMAIFTARPGELTQSAQAALLRDSIVSSGGASVSVAPLDEGQTSELLEYLLSHGDLRPTGSIRRSLVRASGGFPMVLELLVQDWRSNGASSAALALEAMTAEFVGGASPVAAYGRILSRLAGTLEPATKAALDLASVLGNRLNDLSMYSLIDLSLGQTMAALGQLSEVRILRDGEEGLEFINELIRTHSYASVPSSVRKALHASVADRFLHEDDPCSTSRLEIAWHCMRAGRPREAIPHLLTGATDAIRGGAPQSADRALASALPSLQGDDRLRATMLLVEALQEQGRWRESLDTIEALEDRSPEGMGQEAFALSALAKAYLGTPMDEWLAFLPILKNIMETCPHGLSRVRAAKAVAHATSDLRDHQLARDMLEALQGIAVDTLEADARSHLGLAKALLLFQAGDMEASYHEAEVLLGELTGRGAANSLVVHLHTGLGSIRGRQGRYAEATGHHEEALRLAMLLGNETLTAQICANLAFCYGRLGRHEDQLRCATSGPRSSALGIANFTDVHLASSIAFAHGAEGRIAAMREAINTIEERLGPHVPRSITQSWYLWKADILTVAGLRQEARSTAEYAVRGYHLRIESRALTGTFARWAAITCLGTEAEQGVRELLSDLDCHLQDYDALDQVDILCARLYCGWAAPSEYRERILSRISRLPVAALAPLRASGLAASI